MNYEFGGWELAAGNWQRMAGSQSLGAIRLRI